MGEGSRRALITGAAGFSGRHLAAELLAAGYGVAGLDVAHAPIAGVATYRADLADTERVEWVLRTVRPATVFHLAALTDPNLPYEALHQANVHGTLSLLAAVRAVCPDARVVVTSSSAVYGASPQGAAPIDEAQPFRPASLYAVSKIGQEMVAYREFAAHRLAVIRARAFNLTGPGESAGFVTSAFARQIAGIEARGGELVIRVGSLDPVRDFVDVRDAVRAYRLLAEHGAPGEAYNVCTGAGTPVRRVLELLLELSRARPIRVEMDPERLQPADVPVQVGDGTALRRATGWEPGIALEQTLAGVLEDWRERVRSA